MTQLQQAKQGTLTKQMLAVAKQESLSPELICRGVAAGTIVIPYNKNRPRAKAVGVGKGLRTKVSASIGTGKNQSDASTELTKLNTAVEAGTDALMDLSLGGNLDQIRVQVLAATDLPVGTLPAYQTFMEASQTDGVLKLKKSDFINQIRRQAEAGVDFIAIHSAMTRRTLELAKSQGRLQSLSSWGGSLLAGWMLHHDQENPFYTEFEEILAICQQHDVTLALADGLRPGCIHDSLDRSQIQELVFLGEQVQAARDFGVQIMIKGPGHAPITHLNTTVQLMKQLCREAPYFMFGPVVTDVAPGYDHITAAIGATLSAAAGADFLCYVTPAEHVRFPTVADVRQGVIAARIAAHCGDLAKGLPQAWAWDEAMAKARSPWDVAAQKKLALDPCQLCLATDSAAETMEGTHRCQRCGKECAMKVVSEFFDLETNYC